MVKIETKQDLIAFFDISQSFFNSAYWIKGQDKYRKLIINKATGKPRAIHRPTKKLKIIQRIALEKLQSEKKFQPRGHAHGFTPSKSIITNAACHIKSKRIIKMDLKDFFPSIHFGRVRGMFMSYPFEFGEKAATIMAQLACLDDKTGELPQGGPLSPYIANMMCRRLDKRLAEVARSHRCHFTRYADDITFSTNDKSQNNIDSLIKETSLVIESEGFVVNKDKTKVLTPEERQVVTGIIVNDGINVNRRFVRDLRATLFNCDSKGIESQIDRKIYKDKRSSRPNLNASLYHPSKGYFLKHLLGKISFYGSVVLSNEQDIKNRKNPELFKRIQAYENILFRFYELIKKPEEKVDSRFIDSVHTLLSKRPNLRNKLFLKERIRSIRKNVLIEFQNQTLIQNRLNELESIDNLHELEFFIERLERDDPRIFSDLKRSPNFKELRSKLHKVLLFPKVDLIRTRALLKSLHNSQLKRLVHDDHISVKECYAILCDNYESEYYYLPWRLKDEFETWKTHLEKVFNQHGESHIIKGLTIDPLMVDATMNLKKNTRFSGSPSSSSDLENEIQAIITKLKLKDDRVDVRVDRRIAIYTHVPSILKAIKHVLISMNDNSEMNDSSDKKNTIIIEMSETSRSVELRIFDDSEKTQPDTFNNRIFVHGKLRKVIGLTNGLCSYWVEVKLDNGQRKIINMHNESIKHDESDLSGLSNGFIHRFRFER